jgi:hypothetical protein
MTIDFEMLTIAPCDPVYKLRVVGGCTLRVVLDITGNQGTDYTGACVVLVPEVDYLPEWCSIDAARAMVAADLCSRRPNGWGAPGELVEALQRGAASLEIPEPIVAPTVRGSLPRFDSLPRPGIHSLGTVRAPARPRRTAPAAAE